MFAQTETYLRARRLSEKTVEDPAYTEKLAPQEKDRPEGTKLVTEGGTVKAIWKEGAWIRC